MKTQHWLAGALSVVATAALAMVGCSGEGAEEGEDVAATQQAFYESTCVTDPSYSEVDFQTFDCHTNHGYHRSPGSTTYGYPDCVHTYGVAYPYIQANPYGDHALAYIEWSGPILDTQAECIGARMNLRSIDEDLGVEWDRTTLRGHWISGSCYWLPDSGMNSFVYMGASGHTMVLNGQAELCVGSGCTYTYHNFHMWVDTTYNCGS